MPFEKVNYSIPQIRPFCKGQFYLSDMEKQSLFLPTSGSFFLYRRSNGSLFLPRHSEPFFIALSKNRKDEAARFPPRRSSVRREPAFPFSFAKTHKVLLARAAPERCNYIISAAAIYDL